MTAPNKHPAIIKSAGGMIRYPGLLLMICFAVWWLVAGQAAKAAHITQRSISVSTAVTSAVASHDFNFTFASTTAIGSISFEYCDNSPVFDEVCNAPTGLDVTNATLANQSGNTGFIFDSVNTINNRIVITRPATASSAVASNYDFAGITNPSSAGSQFVKIRTHATTDGSGPFTDWGGVAWASVSTFSIGAYIPPYITFCVGVSVALDCSATSGDGIDLGTFSSNQPRFATSQFAIATNDYAGYSIFSLGPTMTSGNNIIGGSVVPQPSIPGISRFGINLRDNVVPNVGTNPEGVGTGGPSANYNIANFFTYNPGDLIATSPLSTDFNRMTVSYVVNINKNQPVGVYSTTVTYLATVSF